MSAKAIKQLEPLLGSAEDYLRALFLFVTAVPRDRPPQSVDSETISKLRLARSNLIKAIATFAEDNP